LGYRRFSPWVTGNRIQSFVHRAKTHASVGLLTTGMPSSTMHS
jgi:hypothetical protein